MKGGLGTHPLHVEHGSEEGEALDPVLLLEEGEVLSEMRGDRLRVQLLLVVVEVLIRPL